MLDERFTLLCVKGLIKKYNKQYLVPGNVRANVRPNFLINIAENSMARHSVGCIACSKLSKNDTWFVQDTFSGWLLLYGEQYRINTYHIPILLNENGYRRGIRCQAYTVHMRRGIGCGLLWEISHGYCSTTQSNTHTALQHKTRQHSQGDRSATKLARTTAVQRFPRPPCSYRNPNP